MDDSNPLKGSAPVGVGVLFLLECLWVLPVLFSTSLAPVLGLLAVAAIYVYLARAGLPLEERVRALLALSIPLSFYSVSGMAYRDSKLSWFNILAILLVAYEAMQFLLFMKTARNRVRLLCIGIFLLFFSGISLAISRHPQGGLSNIINLCLFVVLICSGSMTSGYKEALWKAYLVGAFTSAFALVIQVSGYRFLGISLGRIAIYPGRTAFSGLFDDFSFLSLYFVSAAMLFLKYAGRRKYLGFFCLSLASVLTSARTGIVALLATIFLSVLMSFRISIKKKVVATVGMVCLAVLALYVFSIIRGGEDLLSPNGRLLTYRNGWDNFRSSPLWGIGMGWENYATSEHVSEFPHNTFLQLLAQTGVLGFGAFVLLVGAIAAMLARAAEPSVAYSFTCIMIGALFIPDIMNSRFLAVLVMIGLGGIDETRRIIDEESIDHRDNGTGWRLPGGVAPRQGL